MSGYIDGFVLPLRRDRVDDYRRVAEATAEIWKAHGALDYWECIGDDLEAPGMRSFSDLVAASADETVVFAWARFASREARDAAAESIAADPGLAGLIDPADPPFELARMAFGGFRPLARASTGDGR